MRRIFTITATLFSLTVLSVENLQAQNSCATDIHLQELLKTNPEVQKKFQQLDEETRAWSNQRSASTTYIIPVVFHVFHKNFHDASPMFANLSEAQIIDQIKILNREFKRQFADTSQIPAPFKAHAGTLNIEFRLATIDPNGNCTNGINRVYSELAHCPENPYDVMKIVQWPPHKYFNVYTLDEIMLDGTCGQGGISSLPIFPSTEDGIVISSKMVGSIGTATQFSGGNYLGRLFMHEVGHYLNLFHTWGNNGGCDDFVADTPPQATYNFGRPTFPHNPNSSCGSGPEGEMFMNYMDYTQGNCKFLFTHGQVARMEAALNSSIGSRNNLWKQSNLLATGTADPYVYPVACAKTPTILPISPIVICAGDSVKFSDISYGGTSDHRRWSFEGGSLSTSTDSIVYVKYKYPGSYDVSLTESTAGSTKTTRFPSRIHVMKPVAEPFVLSESFEDPANFHNTWKIINPECDSTWRLTSSAEYSGSNSIMMYNFGRPAGIHDAIVSPAYDLTSVGNPVLRFRLHIATTAIPGNFNSNTDKLFVNISNDCGETWQNIYQKSGDSLYTVSNFITTPHTPTSASEWRLEQVPIPPGMVSSASHFKFWLCSGKGNNIFIDDINITGITSNYEDHNTSALNIFPNPVMNNLQVESGSEWSGPSIQIIDVSGRRHNLPIQKTGRKVLNIDTAELENGIYLIRIRNNGMEHQKTFLKMRE